MTCQYCGRTHNSWGTAPVKCYEQITAEQLVEIERLAEAHAQVVAERDADRKREYGYSQETVDALTKERDSLHQQLTNWKAVAEQMSCSTWKHAAIETDKLLVAARADLAAARQELATINAQVDYIKRCQQHPEQNPGDELAAAQQRVERFKQHPPIVGLDAKAYCDACKAPFLSMQDMVHAPTCPWAEEWKHE